MKKNQIAPADYVFSIEKLHPTTGLYEILGIFVDEAVVEHLLRDFTEYNVIRIQVFTLGQIEGPIQTITSIEEFMEFQQ